jgi:hypothetical protein
VADHPERAVGGERAGAVGLVVAELGLARRQRAERPGDEGDRLVGIEVADDRQLERAVGEAIADRRAQLLKVQREVGVLRLQREARVAVGDDLAEVVGQRAVGRRVEAGEEVLDVAAE